MTEASAERRPGLVSSTGLTLGTRLVMFGLSLVINIILARALGPEGRGVYAVAVLIPGLISIAVSLGISPANVYYFSKSLFTADELIGNSTAASILIGGVCYAVILAYIELSPSHRFAGIDGRFVLVSCVSVPFLLQTTYLQGLFIGGQRFVFYNLTYFASTAVSLVTVAVFVFALHGSTMGAVIAWTVAQVIASLVAVYGALTLGRMSIRLRWATLRRLLRFGLLSYLSSITSFVNLRFDLLLVNVFSGARQAGLYSVGTSLAEMVWYVANSAGTVLAPRVASAEPEQADRLTEAVCRVVVFVAVTGAVVLGVLAPFVVVLFFGSAFEESKWAVWLLMPGIVTFSVARVLSNYLLGSNRLKIDLLASAVALAVTLALDLALIPPYGFRGAAVASSIAYTCAMAVGLWWVTHRSTITLSSLLVMRRSDAETVARRLRQMAVGVTALGRGPAPQTSRKESGGPGAGTGS